MIESSLKNNRRLLDRKKPMPLNSWKRIEELVTSVFGSNISKETNFSNELIIRIISNIYEVMLASVYDKDIRMRILRNVVELWSHTGIDTGEVVDRMTGVTTPYSIQDNYITIGRTELNVSRKITEKVNCFRNPTLLRFAESLIVAINAKELVLLTGETGTGKTTLI